MLQKENYSGHVAYSQSKLANLMFSNELAPRMQPRGVMVNCVHPGVIATKVLNSGWGGGVGDAKVKHTMLAVEPFGISEDAL